MNADIDAVLRYVQHPKPPQPAAAPPLQLQQLRTILSTHKHWDHAGGNLQLRDQLAKGGGDGGACRIIGGANDGIPGATQAVKEGDTLFVGNLRVRVLDIPCHTRGHVAYVVQHKDHDATGPAAATAAEDDAVAVFTGDTLFLGGLGAFFEGGAADMCAAMRKLFHVNRGAAEAVALLQQRDARTYIFPGHEYTAGFMTFTERILREEERANKQLSAQIQSELRFVEAQKQQYAARVAAGLPSPPSSLADEKVQNLFLRTADPSYVTRMAHKGADAVALMEYLYNACD
ncbi:hydroxyacylglutathione hydrolase [Strigomonas culicis]|nr:hydroxyacylglutathione hydrolase [Strigomonas culicis]EPY34549.1 hydroxyacylglutathione hydrolase [Strigomonas culicis]|eukprot:EPY31863.1 hydroxyacylglutathione hydrolase [Strigomonas culicis]